jgi:Ca2+-binding RTX toxin-like protein
MAISRRRSLLRGLLVGAFVLGANGWTAGTALAAVTSDVTGGVLTVITDAGDSVSVTCVAGDVQVNSADPGSGVATCASVALISVSGDALGNTFDLSGVVGADFTALTHVQVNGADGDDVITGADVKNHLIGGPGADQITGGGADDFISGGPGDDQIDGAAGTDKLIESGDVSFTLTDAALTGLGSDTLVSIERGQFAGGIGANTFDASAFTGSVVLSGGRGDDVLLGGAGNDRLRGSSGVDTLTGGAGSDVLRAGDGDDSLDSVDTVGGNDSLMADQGLDTCTVDVGDAAAGCEL